MHRRSAEIPDRVFVTGVTYQLAEGENLKRVVYNRKNPAWSVAITPYNGIELLNGDDHIRYLVREYETAVNSCQQWLQDVQLEYESCERFFQRLDKL
jgi:hypothetical protein